MDPKSDSQQTSPQDGYFEIPSAALVAKIDVTTPELPNIDLYTFSNGKPQLIRKADQVYSALALSLHKSVWVKREDLPKIRKQAEQVAFNPRLISNMPIEQRVAALRQSAMLVVDDLFQAPTTENIARSTKVVGSFVNLLMKEPQSYTHLAKLSSHDPYTLQHSVGTAVNAIILAKKCGITDEAELLEVGSAGLLHDIGKVKVSREIINKNGPLNDEEWKEMRQHSAQGYEIIKDQKNLSDRTKRAVLEHHEENSGKGYPNGLKEPEIDFFSRIVCISDIFNALTTDRSYSKARSPFEALQLMKEKLSHKVDDELFKKMVMIYGGAV